MKEIKRTNGRANLPNSNVNPATSSSFSSTTLSLFVTTMTPEYASILHNFCQENKMEFNFDDVSSGPQNDETWTAIVLIKGKEAGRGIGKSKRSARAEAAKLVLEVNGWI
ncbi:hypothetical protein K443DRAFT_9702 [Laccaria amethystina LaAM-08-1]|uniref:DRBM domain-containing protein n=1 Tax=Laccaria amethystina LaAM-08-1 TaxID=1095629 RepID=A0A0C9XNV1_9AGAR|nr:hypothetical protein K443DRAFT_9702 [Laccaria amethystina LaAM-08-1]